jgi:D-inositol-3-phosphate glycosyltransferase
MYIGIVEPVGGHGGMDYYDYGLSMGLGYSGIDVTLYTSQETILREFKNVKTTYFFKGVWKSNFFLKTCRYIFGHIRAFLDIRKHGGQVVHLHFFVIRSIDLLVLLIAKLFRLKIVVTIHDVTGFDQRANKYIEQYTYSLIDEIIVHNKTSKQVLESKLPKNKSLSIIPHGNYLPFISRIPDTTGTTFTLLFFGQIKKVKGLDILLEAIQRLKTDGVIVSVIIAGKAWKSDLDEYKRMINEFGIQDFIETDFRYIPDQEVADYYSRAHLVVLPYKEIYQSGVLLLTMSYGKPVICSDLHAFTEIIKDGVNGYLFRTQNPDDLADKIKGIMKNRLALENVVSEANLTIEDDYDWRKIGKDTALIYRKLLA